MKDYKRVLSLLLATIMTVSVFTIGAFATDDDSVVVDENNSISAQSLQDNEGTDAQGSDDAGTPADVEAEAETEASEGQSSQPGDATLSEQDAEPEVSAEVATSYLTIENEIQSDGSNFATDVVIKKGSTDFTSTITAITLVEKVTSGTPKEVKVTSGDYAKDLETGIKVSGLTAGKTYDVKINDTECGTVMLPAQPAGLKVDGKTSVEYTTSTASKLTWGAVTGAKSYDVYRYDAKNKKWTLYKNVSTNNCTDTVTTKDVKYTYKVYAVYQNDASSDKITVKMHSVASNSVTVLNYTVLGAVKNLKGYKYKAAQYSGTGNSNVISPNSIKLKWDKVSGATGYRIYRYDNHTKKYKAIKDTTSTTATCGSLKNGYKYSFKVKALRNGRESSKYSNVAGPYTISYQTSKVHAIWYKGVITGTAKCFSSKSSKKVVKKISKGTKVKVLQRANGRSQILTSSGKVYWVNRSKCHYTSQIYNSKKDWTTSAKESFVKNYSSKTKYLIFVSQYTQRVNVFQGKKGNWKLIKTGLCATGKIERKTPMGTFKVFQKEKGWFYNGYKNAPVVHFAARNSFHSRPTYYNGKVKTKTIGKPASNGCVRMEQGYVDWIYKYVPLGTTVICR